MHVLDVSPHTPIAVVDIGTKVVAEILWSLHLLIAPVAATAAAMVLNSPAALVVIIFSVRGRIRRVL
jgi:hypothetical protein